MAISTSPGSGNTRDGHSSGNHSSNANGLPGTPRGSSSQNAPASASGKANQRASGSHHSANGDAASRSNSGHDRSKVVADSDHSACPAPACSDSAAVPSKASGTTTRLHQGTATRLANGPASEACPNSTTVNGSRPSAATPCAPRNSRRGCCRPCGRHHSSQATPAKLSQKPAPSGASGSTSSTAIAASAKASAADCCRRPSRAPSTITIISSVRTVGNANPATAAYTRPPQAAARPAARTRGQRRPSVGHSHHRARANKAKKPAAIPTWKPEIAIRWVRPFARSTFQSASSRPPVSPSASARTKREDGFATADAIRRDMRSRHASIPRPRASLRASSGSRT